ncbi:MAG TPA: hypothetical protein VMF52_08255 [Steroidobacteraceae bacterium]|nr:hypothetical protein [Steroidobacteraceae bacterium]
MTKLIGVAMLLLAAAAFAQSPPPAAPGSDLEPGVNTSAPTAQPTEVKPADARPAPPAAKPVAAKPAAASGAAAASANKQPAAGAPKGNAKDRLDLDSTQITGNRELPKVLYIVPWRSAEMGDLVGRPVNSLLDEVLEPVDRDVFRRQNRYYDALQPNAATPAAAPASQPEK